MLRALAMRVQRQVDGDSVNRGPRARNSLAAVPEAVSSEQVHAKVNQTFPVTMGICRAFVLW
jgi:hypothetical protein